VSDTIFRTGRRDALLIMTGAALTPLLPPGAARAVGTGFSPGRDQDFDSDWRFHRGAGSGLEAMAFDDSTWRSVDLPHDWSIEDLPNPSPPNRVGPFDAKAEGGGGAGFVEGGEGWYRKRFRLSLSPGAKVEIVFGGVYTVSEVWLNGHSLGTHVHGYTPFAYDLSPHLDPTGENVIAVRVRNVGKTTRFYSGSGIYRSVRLDVFPEGARIARWGVAAWTQQLVAGRATVKVGTKVEQTEPGLILRTRLRASSGCIAAEARSPAQGETQQVLQVARPELWSPADPNLYVLESELLRGERVIDRLVQPFGIRIVVFDAKTGMTINGERVKIRGGCVHHDNGLLGGTAFADADERRVLLLKARGYNAIRSSHYPSAETFRNACDRHGVLLIEEAFDMWHNHKSDHDYATYFAENWQDDLRAMVLSARNSPSVIMWSIGNEIPDRASTKGLRTTWDLANEVHRLDPTRPVTAAIHSFSGRPVVADAATVGAQRAGKPYEASMIFLDVPGYNYRLDDIERDHLIYPDRVAYASETYPLDAYDYGELSERAPYFLGEFVWAAIDYLGETGIGAAVRRPAPAPGKQLAPLPFMRGYPWVVSNCGDIDLIGGQKPQSYYRDVVWGLSPLEVLVQRPVPEGQVESLSKWGWSDELKSWTWPGAEGRPLRVRAFTRGDRVELRLNGKIIGSKSVATADRRIAEFMVPYAAGVLEAVSLRGGTVLARQKLETAGRPAKLRVVAEKARGARGRDRLSYIGVEVLDAQGRLVPDARVSLELNLGGPAQLVGFGSASPFAEGAFRAINTKTHQGRALVILRGTKVAGAVRVEVRGDGLAAGVTTLAMA
jgi:beta-galactosidase